MTLVALSLPDCLEPMFTVGILRKGVSIIPLLEFPTNADEIFSKLIN